MKELDSNNFDTELLVQFYPETSSESDYCLIDVDQIEPNPYQPRINYSKDALEKLTQSIQENGMIQPIIVQNIEGRYQIIAGERRWRAYLLMGKQQIEAIVKSVDDKTNAVWALTENIAREDLTDYEIGKAIRHIEKDFAYKKDLAASLGINRTDFYRYLAFDCLPRYIIKDLDSNPKLLSRFAADQIKKTLIKHQGSCSVLSFLETAWELLKDGKLQQTQITRFIDKELKKVYGLNQATNEKIILNKNGIPFGQVNQTKKFWTVQLDVDGINEHQQQQILSFIQQLFNESTESVAS